MTKELMATVGLGRVLRTAPVADVLGRVEHSEGQAGQEVSRRQQARDWTETEARAVLEELRHNLELRYVVGTVATVGAQQAENDVELFAGVGWIQRGQLVEDHAPSLDLVLGVLDVRDLLAVPVVEGDVGEHFAPLPIHLI